MSLPGFRRYSINSVIISKTYPIDDTMNIIYTQKNMAKDSEYQHDETFDSNSGDNLMATQAKIT